MDIGIIGGINIDIEGAPFRSIRYRDSNPGTIRIAYGGVGRNIAENTARLGGNCAMISVCADEPMSRGAVENLRDLGVDVSHVKVISDGTPSMYLSILNENRDMELAVSDMSIINNITPEYIDELTDWLKDTEIIALDGNLSERLLDYATCIFEDKKLFYDPVSASKGVRAKNFAGRFFAIKPNVMEAEAILGIKIKTDEDIVRAAERFMELGVQQVYITLGKDGVFYMDKDDSGFIRPWSGIDPVSATGAGDSFSACILIGLSEGMSVRDTAILGAAAAQMTLESENAVNDRISREELNKRIGKEHKI